MQVWTYLYSKEQEDVLPEFLIGNFDSQQYSRKFSFCLLLTDYIQAF